MHRLGQNGQKLSGKTVGRDKVKKGWLRESHPLLPSRLEPPNQNLLGLSLHFSSFLMVGGGRMFKTRQGFSVYNPGNPRTHFVDQAALELPEILSSKSPARVN